MIKKIKMRSLLIGGVITLFFALLIGRIFYLQVIDNDFWQQKALANWDREQVLTASRGSITDRDGDVLAMDAPAYTVTVNPEVINENGMEEEVVDGLHRVLGKPKDELRELVTAKKENGEYYVSREIRNEGWKIDEDKKNEVLELRKELEKQLTSQGKVADTGIGLLNEQKRSYPQQTLAAHILGWVDRQGEAKAGIEVYYDELLKGTDGFAKYQSDKKGVKVPSADEVYQPAKDGKNLMLTIDDTIQYYIEEAMQEAYNEYNPLSMTVVAADPNTMEILGMASMPTFDPNNYWEADAESFRNHAISSIYEPGSTFKIVTLASAIEENLFNANDTYKSGSIRAGGRNHYDIQSGGWGTISYLEGVKRSSNVAFVKLGYEMLGKERLKNYINAFGFSEKTNIGLPGESLGRLNMERDIDLSTVPYGYAVSVTPIQQIAAISAVANGGKLMKPQIIKQIEDPNTGEVETVEPEVIREVISEETARETGTYLEQVVADLEIGTGRNAYIDGYRVAGKTGTAVKSTGGYSDRDKLVVSFIGYAPVDDPKIAVLVIIDEPKNSGDITLGGGSAAAPVFKKIVSQTLKYWGVPKSQTDSEESGESSAPAVSSKPLETPELVNEKTEDVTTKLLAEGYIYEVLGKGTTVKEQYPPAGTSLASGQKIYLITEESKTMEVPDLKGQSLRDAMDVLNLMKVQVSIKGEGYVTEQKEATEKGQRVVYLTLEPANSGGEGSDTGEASGAEAPDGSAQEQSGGEGPDDGEEQSKEGEDE